MYLVILEESLPIDQLRDFAAYLSLVSVADFDVVVVDDSPSMELNGSVLRWVGRHLAARPQHRAPGGEIDPIRAAIDVAACEKVIVADRQVRYCEEALEDLVALLDLHEVVEPQDYLDPLPWWGGIDAGRMLLHRGVEPLPDHGATFGFRKSAVRGLRSIDGTVTNDHVRRLASQGAEVFSAIQLFVRRLPPMFDQWIRERPLQAVSDFVLPLKSLFFFSVIPFGVLLAIIGGGRLAAGYAGAMAFGAIALALRGRSGAGLFFPWRACFYAPLWVMERSLSVYWALLWKLRPITRESGRLPLADRPSGARAASGE